MQASNPQQRSTGGPAARPLARALWFVGVCGVTLACGLWLVRAAEPRPREVEGTPDRAGNRASARAYVIQAGEAAQKAHAKLQIAQSRLRDALAELERFVPQMLTPPIAASLPETPTAPPPPAATPNPRYVQLQAEIEAVEGRRLSLLGTMTSVHPAIQDLDLQLAELKARRDAEPPELPHAPLDSAALVLQPANHAPAPKDSANNSNSSAGAGPMDPTAGTAESTLVELQLRHYESLKATVESSYGEVRRLSLEAWNAAQLLAQANAERHALDHEIAAEQSAGSLLKMTSHARLALQALLGLMAIGLGVSAASFACAELPTLDSVDEIERQLRVPVLAAISISSDLRRTA